ncbi:GIY-YIG nuclease family protein [Eubacterium aggregans]|uniref:GIY-YIG nuclease family protein n=1 Tax=Eubacterium aggregans TaxID=81409 RepID=UPI003F317993
MQSTTNQDMVIALNEKINELKRQLEAVAQKKEEIISRQNGKAGNVYIISNLGSFGKNVFKIGMTRRLEPQDRIRELSEASVPFQFDVHSLIFSDDAVALESKLHTILNEKRVNKINMRKEFFSITIDEIEELVHRLDPTAEFITTMLAEEYRQTQSLIGDAV